MAHIAFRTDLPEELAVLAELALDLRWTWSHAGDDLWRMIPRCTWGRFPLTWFAWSSTPMPRTGRNRCGSH